MKRTLEQLVEDWFLNSPGWPMAEIDVERETRNILRDGTIFSEKAIREEIARFAKRNHVTALDAWMQREQGRAEYREGGRERADTAGPSYQGLY